MAYNKKTWFNRETEYPNRYTMTSANGNVADVSIVPNNGAVTATGEEFSAEVMNNLETRIESGFNDVATDLDTAVTTLQENVDNEETRAKTAEQGITTDLGLANTKIDNEITRATAKEDELEDRLDDTDADVANLSTTITSIRTTANSALSIAQDANANLTIETNRAQQAETTLQGNIDTVISGISGETQRATAAENALDSRITDVENTVTRTYKASGSIYFADLPQLAESRIGNVYNIKDDFITTADFIEGAGKSFPSGTNVAIEQIEEIAYTEIVPVGDENPSEEVWYEYDETEDEYFLSEDTTVDATKTYYVRTDYALYYDIPSGFIDTSDFITNTDYATSSKQGIVKPDGTSVTVDNDGTIHSVAQGGHTIVDENGTSLSQRDNLQFINATITDDAVNNKTVVEVQGGNTNFEGTREEWNQLTRSQKAQYHTYDFKNDFNGMPLDTTVIQGSANPVTGGAVYNYVNTMITSALTSSY